MANLERKIAAPQASPKMIAAVVANLSTSTVEAPGILSAKMIRRLDEVAIRNGGRVPLHGRLFAQWLHLVFPRECPYPHTSGSRSPLSASEWLEANPGNLNMKRKEMRQYIDRAHENGQAGDNDASGEEDFTQWSHEEEILYLPAQLAAVWETKLLRASLVWWCWESVPLLWWTPGSVQAWRSVRGWSRRLTLSKGKLKMPLLAHLGYRLNIHVLIKPSVT